MKNLFKNSVYLVLIMAFLAVSCKDENVLPQASMNATVNGNEWKSAFRVTTINKTAEKPNITILGTPGLSATADHSIMLTAFGTGEGEYKLSIGELSGDCGVVYKKTANAGGESKDYYVSYEATVNISDINTNTKRMSGTFNAKLRSAGDPTSKITIENGSFSNLLYIER